MKGAQTMKQNILHPMGMKISVTVHGEELSAQDVEAVKAIDDAIYCNDLTGELWMFDRQLPSGRWLENLHPRNDLRTATALVF